MIRRPPRSTPLYSSAASDVYKRQQTVGWIKMKLGMEVGLNPGHMVLDGDPAPSKRGTAPNFWPMSVVAKRWMNQDATWYRGRPQPRPHCVIWGSSIWKGAQRPPSFWPMSIVAKRSPISATAELLLLYPQPVTCQKEFLPAALRAAQTCRYLIYSEADFEPLLRAKFHPHRCNDKGVGPPKLKFLLRFDRNVKYKRLAGAYPCLLYTSDAADE